MVSHDKKIIIYWSWQKTVSIICACLIVPLLLVFLFSLTLKTTIINPEFYKKNLEKNNTYDRLIHDGIPSLVLESNISDNQFSDILSKDIIIYVVQKSIDPLWIQNLTNSLIDQIATYFAATHDSGKKIELDLSQSSDFLYKVSNGLTLVSQLVPNCTNSTVALGSCKNVNTDEIKNDILKIQTKIDQANLGVIDIQNYVTNANSFILNIQNIIQNMDIELLNWMNIIIVCMQLIRVDSEVEI